MRYTNTLKIQYQHPSKSVDNFFDIPITQPYLFLKENLHGRIYPTNSHSIYATCKLPNHRIANDDRKLIHPISFRSYYTTSRMESSSRTAQWSMGNVVGDNRRVARGIDKLLSRTSIGEKNHLQARRYSSSSHDFNQQRIYPKSRRIFSQKGKNIHLRLTFDPCYSSVDLHTSRIGQNGYGTFHSLYLSWSGITKFSSLCCRICIVTKPRQSHRI